jgi:4-diphosphocytidyl-2-C-methyl-D-erythritol kinase
VFSAAELTRDCAPITIRAFLEQGAANVCESVVVKRYPVVADMLDWLRDLPGQLDAKMTGTGASGYAAFAEQAAAQRALHSLPEQWRGFVARGVNRSPLLAVEETEKQSKAR